MSEVPDPQAKAAALAARHGAMLARLGDAGLELALDLQAAALAATDARDKASLAFAFHRISRSVRQSIALEARLVRDQGRHDRDEAERAAIRAAAAVETRKTQVRVAVERLIWTEQEPGEAEVWSADLADRLDDEALHDGFTDETIEAHIARAGRELGVTGAATCEYVPRSRRGRSHGPPPRTAAYWAAMMAEIRERDGLPDPEEDEDDEEDEEPPHPPEAKTPPPEAETSPPEADPDPFKGRLAPPMDLPSWEAG